MIHSELHESESDSHLMGEATCDVATPKAVLVMVTGVGKMWIPKSALHDDSEVYGKGHTGKLIVHLWWAKARGLVAP